MKNTHFRRKQKTKKTLGLVKKPIKTLNTQRLKFWADPYLFLIFRPNNQISLVN